MDLRGNRLQHQGFGAMLLPLTLAFALLVQVLLGHTVTIQSSGRA